MEVVVALLLLFILATAIVPFAVTALKAQSRSEDISVAAQIANSQIEVARSRIETADDCDTAGPLGQDTDFKGPWEQDGEPASGGSQGAWTSNVWVWLGDATPSPAPVVQSNSPASASTLIYLPESSELCHVTVEVVKR